mmetsp:Transcript_43299/g.131762  ORF Transcript_43299/g.131762 Transcript_43299/m.131762 type:complete len:201 (+) Transcript_43299:698-1300(+)
MIAGGRTAAQAAWRGVYPHFPSLRLSPSGYASTSASATIFSCAPSQRSAYLAKKCRGSLPSSSATSADLAQVCSSSRITDSGAPLRVAAWRGTQPRWASRHNAPSGKDRRSIRTIAARFRSPRGKGDASPALSALLPSRFSPLSPTSPSPLLLPPPPQAQAQATCRGRHPYRCSLTLAPPGYNRSIVSATSGGNPSFPSP